MVQIKKHKQMKTYRDTTYREKNELDVYRNKFIIRLKLTLVSIN